MITIGVMNGPNLNLLGEREPEVYGHVTLRDINEQLVAKFSDVQLVFFQSNVEGELINCLQEWNHSVQGIVMNPGGYSHTSVAIADCVTCLSVPIVEIHISNIHARESMRHHSITGAHCDGIITGFGVSGYELAISAVKNMLL